MLSEDIQYLQNLIGRKITYDFTAPQELEDSIEDSFYRTSYFNGFIDTQNLKVSITGTKGALSFDFYLEDYNSVDDLVNDYYSEATKLNESILDDDTCLANCSYSRGPSGFCSQHQYLNSEEYRLYHSEAIKNRIRRFLQEIIDFSEEPLHEQFISNFSGESIKVIFTLSPNVPHKVIPKVNLTPFEVINTLSTLGQLEKYVINPNLQHLAGTGNTIITIFGKTGPIYHVKAIYDPVIHQIFPPV